VAERNAVLRALLAAALERPPLPRPGAAHPGLNSHQRASQGPRQGCAVPTFTQLLQHTVQFVLPIEIRRRRLLDLPDRFAGRRIVSWLAGRGFDSPDRLRVPVPIRAMANLVRRGTVSQNVKLLSP
jgi:hypothetical protein